MRKNQFRTFAGILSLSALLGVGVLTNPVKVAAATEHWNDGSAPVTESWTKWKENWETYSTNYENVSLTPGANESQLNFAWYSKTAETPKVKLGIGKDMSKAQEFAGKQTPISDATLQGAGLTGAYYSNKVTVTGLKEKTQYYYQVFQNGEWKEAKPYKTGSASAFSFLYVGDPQIGACKNQTSNEGEKLTNADSNLAARNDAYNWNNILKNAVEDHSNVSFMVSAGDQVNYANNEREYAGYLGAEALASLPVSTTIGNHDSGTEQYSLHYNNPNTFGFDETRYTKGHTAAGSDYYYTYGNTLFIVLDTNNYNAATHRNVIKKAVEENKDAKWRVVMFHQDIYGSGLDHSDSDGMILRTALTPIMDEFDIDVVLQGHDHTYSRTYQLSSSGRYTIYDTKNNGSYGTAYQTDNELCYNIESNVKSGTVTNPEGTVYIEANSATGSKFYELIPSQQDYISERSQTWTPTYSVIDVTDDTFKITTYDSKTRKELAGSSSYTIIKKEEKKETQVQKTQTIKAASSVKKAVNSKVFSLKASTNGNGALSYTSSNPKVASVSRSGNVTVKSIGTAKITIKAAATSTYKAATKTVSVTVTPKKASLVKVSAAGAKKVKLTWKKDKTVSGYRIAYSYSKNFKSSVKTVMVKKNTKIAATLTKLKKGNTLYVKVRAYKTVGGKRIYGSYSTPKKVKIK
ncbi:MAG: fibronectin type III domain-containing protein [Eubacterium sp.]|nr:fibronectin type III domain-containing protein [Eubacterium sp.]